MLSKVEKYPIIFILSILIIIITTGQNIHLKDFFLAKNIDLFYAKSIGSIIYNSITLFFIVVLIFKIKVPFSFFNITPLSNNIYYIPLLIYIVIFSGGFQNFEFSSIDIPKLTTYSSRIFISALLEEVLFRGMVLGLLLNKFYNSKNGILKSVLISGFIFGGVHIVNLWAYDNSTINGVLHQIYAASCLGIMYGAVYLKTKNILFISFLHFTSNFLSLYTELLPNIASKQINDSDTSILNLIISELFTIIIFGIPLIIGLYIIYKTKRNDIKYLLNNQKLEKNIIPD